VIYAKNSSGPMLSRQLVFFISSGCWDGRRCSRERKDVILVLGLARVDSLRVVGDTQNDPDDDPGPEEESDAEMEHVVNPLSLHHHCLYCRLVSSHYHHVC